MAMRCRWPPDSRWPRSPIVVSKPDGRAAMNSWACAARAAASTMARSAAGDAYAMLFAIVSSNSTVSCVTMPMLSRSDRSVTSRMSTPSIRMAPSVTS